MDLSENLSGNIGYSRKQHYEIAFRQAIRIHSYFKTIRDIVSEDDYKDDPASTATDIVLEQLLDLYLEEEWHIPEASDDLIDNFYDYIWDCVFDIQHDLFTLGGLDKIIADILDSESVYPEEYENDRECVL